MRRAIVRLHRGTWWVLLALAMLAPRTAAAANNPRWSRYAGLGATADSLQRAGAAPAAFALLDSIRAVALQREDPDLRMVVTMARARMLLATDRADDAETLTRSLLLELRAAHDTLGITRATRYLARADEIRGRTAAAGAGYTRALSMARQARIPVERAWALLGLASLDFSADRLPAAADRYRQAVALFERTDETRGLLLARAGYARGLQTLGRYDQARPLHLELLAQARARNDLVLEAQTSFNLATLELKDGDPGKATGYYRRSLEIYRQLGWTDRVVSSSNALAIVNVNLGRLDEADSTLLLVLPAAERTRNLELRARVLCQVGIVRRELGRPAEAAAFGRRAVAYSDSITAMTAIDVTLPLLATLEQSSHYDEALALLDQQIARLTPRLSDEPRRRLQVSRGILLRKMGRPNEALEVMRPSAQGSTTVRGGYNGANTLNDLAELARCYRDVGDLDSALVWFGLVTDRWEQWRAGTSDPGWRERYDDFARRFSGDYALALLVPRHGLSERARTRLAFDALQRFRARTLGDRIHDPAARNTQALHAIGALALQRRVLRPGEVLVDVHALPETTLVFVLTSDSVRVHGARRAGSLVPRLERLRSLLADPTSASSGLVGTASATLGAEMFGPAADRLAGARRILLSAGTLARYPLDQLTLPGEHGALMLLREVTWIPAATLLADSRATTRPRAARPLLAVAQSAAVDGIALPAARREASWLADRYQGAEMLADASIANAATVASRAGNYQVLHLAAHTRSGGRRPWQDAFHVGPSTDDAAWLTAARIAQLRIPARLCVLAGCTTVGDIRSVGETLEGLSTAWLAAGAPTVIATRWRVDDAATSELVRRFYDRLARGETASMALRGAQLEVRDLPVYASPFYWAGACLLGEPDTRVTLTPRHGR